MRTGVDTDQPNKAGYRRKWESARLIDLVRGGQMEGHGVACRQVKTIYIMATCEDVTLDVCELYKGGIAAKP